MAIQPKARAAGSSLSLRFTGNVTLGANNFGDYSPAIANGVIPADAATGVPVGVRFLLADATDPTDFGNRLPDNAYDDSQPAGAAPHAPTFAASGAITTITDADISLRTWAQNLDIEIVSLAIGGTATAVTADVAGAKVVLDLTDSGLGGNTGLPVLILPMTFTFAAPGPAAVLDMVVTVRHSAVR